MEKDSTCPKGKEQWETIRNGNMYVIRYEYRDNDDELFVTVVPGLAQARIEKDLWLQNKHIKISNS